MDQEDDAKSMVSGSVPASVELMTETGNEVEDGIQHEKVDGETFLILSEGDIYGIFE